MKADSDIWPSPQWDPERDIQIEKLPYRSIQIGLTGEAARRYACEWDLAISDITALAHEIHALVKCGDLEAAKDRLPAEAPYPLDPETALKIGAEP